MSDEALADDERLPDPITFKALHLRLVTLEQRAARHAKEAQEIARELSDLATDMFFKRLDSPDATLKRDSGRLSDEGIRVIHAAFANGMRVGDAAKTFGISQSAASARYKEWKASQRVAPPPEPPPVALKLEPEPPLAAPVPMITPEPPAAQVEPEPPPAAPTPEPPLTAAKPKRRPRRATKPTGDG